jgi:hypothetical protein
MSLHFKRPGRLLAALAAIFVAAGAAPATVLAASHSQRHHKPTPHRVTKHTSNGIPQNNGGDHDSDNNGGPSDGDGNL